MLALIMAPTRELATQIHADCKVSLHGLKSTIAKGEEKDSSIPYRTNALTNEINSPNLSDYTRCVFMGAAESPIR